MIQRKQTIYMLGAAVCMILLGVLNMYTFNADAASMELRSYGSLVTENGETTFVPSVKASCMVAIIGISAVLYLVNIFLYKRRETQLSFLYAQYVLILGAVGYGAYYVISLKNLFEEYVDGKNLELLTSVPGWVLILPVVALLMNFLAVRGVAGDIALLRSVDRIR